MLNFSMVFWQAHHIPCMVVTRKPVNGGVHTGLYLGFECNLFLVNALFWVSGGSLGLKHPTNSCKPVAFAMGSGSSQSTVEHLK